MKTMGQILIALENYENKNFLQYVKNEDAAPIFFYIIMCV